MNKPGWLKDAVAKADGYYSTKGEKLKSAKLSQDQIDAWNGKPAKKAAPAPKVEVEEVETDMPAPKKKTTKKTSKKAAPKKGTLADKLKGMVSK